MIIHYRQFLVALIFLLFPIPIPVYLFTYLLHLVDANLGCTKSNYARMRILIFNGRATCGLG